jgi:SAM-dependent methyltransferase
VLHPRRMPSALTHCPVCRSEHHLPIEAFRHPRIEAHYGACVTCGLVAMDPMPTTTELEAYYREHYWAERDTSAETKLARQRRRAEQLHAFLERTTWRSSRGCSPGNLKILEIGSALGESLVLLRAQLQNTGAEANLYAIEPNDAMRATPNYQWIQVLGRWVDDLESQTERFDLVVLSHVLEHFPDPVRALTLVRNCLTESGQVYIEVPNFYGHPSADYGHNFCFTESTLRATVQAAGLSIRVLEVTGHEEDFPFYVSCVVESASGNETPPLAEPIDSIRRQRAAARHAFSEYRARNPRPA